QEVPLRKLGRLTVEHHDRLEPQPPCGRGGHAGVVGLDRAHGDHHIAAQLAGLPQQELQLAGLVAAQRQPRQIVAPHPAARPVPGPSPITTIGCPPSGTWIAPGSSPSDSISTRRAGTAGPVKRTPARSLCTLIENAACQNRWRDASSNQPSCGPGRTRTATSPAGMGSAIECGAAERLGPSPPPKTSPARSLLPPSPPNAPGT